MQDVLLQVRNFMFEFEDEVSGALLAEQLHKYAAEFNHPSQLQATIETSKGHYSWAPRTTTMQTPPRHRHC